MQAGTRRRPRDGLVARWTPSQPPATAPPSPSPSRRWLRVTTGTVVVTTAVRPLDVLRRRWRLRDVAARLRHDGPAQTGTGRGEPVRRMWSENPRPLLFVRGGQEMARHVSAVFPVHPDPGHRNQMFLPRRQHILQGRLPKVSVTLYIYILCIILYIRKPMCGRWIGGKPLLLVIFHAILK